MTTLKARGFTIVELLIVIVVIAILAAITVAAYRGISSRAEDSAIASKVKSLAQIIEAYGAANGGLAPHADWACVGEPEDFPAENGYQAGWCTKPADDPPPDAGWVHPINTTLNTKIKTIVNRVPDTGISDVPANAGYTWRGILYDSSTGWNNNGPVIHFKVKGVRSSCPIGVVVYTEAIDTVCQYRFTGLTSEPAP